MFLVRRPGDVVTMTDSMKIGARRHASSADWVNYYGKRINVEREGGVPGNRWCISADEISVWCNTEDCSWAVGVLLPVVEWNIGNAPRP